MGALDAGLESARMQTQCGRDHKACIERNKVQRSRRGREKERGSAKEVMAHHRSLRHRAL